MLLSASGVFSLWDCLCPSPVSSVRLPTTASKPKFMRERVYLSGEFIVVEMPWSQELLNEKGFKENSELITSTALVEEYGSDAYFVRRSWHQKIAGYKEFYLEPPTA